jgi:probable HAF family extracellular repeat protein
VAVELTGTGVRYRDHGVAGLGGPNSSAGGVNLFGQVMGGADSAAKDPNNENFCAYGTGLACRAFLWQHGVMTALPTLGGPNGNFGGINNLGQIAGFAENSHRDPDCLPGPAVNGTGPQVLDYEAVIWGPWPGQVRELHPLPGDTVGIANSINDFGQAVGTSGTCANTVIPGAEEGPHAVLWESDGSVHDLGNLGGTSNPAILGPGNVAWVINDLGEVTGQSSLPGSASFHPFLWTEKTGMRDLGVLPGDLVGAGLGMNNLTEVVGASITAPGLAGGNPRAYVWVDGVMSDLNALIPADSPLYLLTAFAINDFGEITGFGATSTGELHGFLAKPCGRDSASDGCQAGSSADALAVEKPSVVLTENARKLLLRLGLNGRVGR